MPEIRLTRAATLIAAAAVLCLPAVAGATPPTQPNARSLSQTPDGGVIKTTPGRFLSPSSSAAAAAETPIGLSATAENIQFVGKLQLTAPFGDVRPEQIADVSAKGDYAYLNSWQSPGLGLCERGGVFVVDISNPADPKQVTFIPSSPGSYPGEGSQVISVNTPSFRGDVLTINNEACAGSGNAATLDGGISLIDVTDPRNPVKLAEGVGDITPSAAIPGVKDSPVHLSHSAFSWHVENNPATVDDNKAYTVFVDNEEEFGTGEDVDIMDITNPRAPVFINELTLDGFSGGSSAFPDDVFLHDMVVEPIDGKQILLASYWDGGYVQMDVTDPMNPTLVADSDFLATDPLFTNASPPEGNAHQAEFSHDKSLVVAADEDFSPYRLFTEIDGVSFDDFGVGVPVDLAGNPIPGLGIDVGTDITGDTRFVGLACDPGTIAPPTAGVNIAVAERGVCDFDLKSANAAAAGYDALLIINNVVGDATSRCDVLLNMTFDDPNADIPTLFLGRSIGFEVLGLFDENYTCVPNDDAASTDTPAAPAEGVPIEWTVEFDGWGYMHLFDRATMQELDQYAVAETMDERYALGFGDLSVHETANDPATNLAYVSYYRAGLRVLRFSRENGLEEVGRYIDTRGNNFWGVHQMTDKQGGRLILASDRDYGLYVLRYTGPDAVLPQPPTQPPPPTPPAGPLPGRCANAVAGTASVDRLTGGAAGDSIRAGAGNDVLSGADGDDCLFGEAGRDEISGDRGNDRVDGGGDRDRLFGDAGRDDVRGGSGRDSLSGSSGSDRLFGGTGNDQIDGDADNDRLTGSGGNDGLRGGSGRDRLNGGGGNDTLDVGAGRRNTAIGGTGRDRVLAANGFRDTIRCGRGRDTVIADRNDRVARDCERVRRVR